MVDAGLGPLLSFRVDRDDERRADLSGYGSILSTPEKLTMSQLVFTSRASESRATLLGAGGVMTDNPLERVRVLGSQRLYTFDESDSFSHSG